MLAGGLDPSQCECCGFGSADWRTLTNAKYSVEDQIACAFMIKGCEGILDNSDIGDVPKICALKKVLCRSKKTFIATVLDKYKKKATKETAKKETAKTKKTFIATKETAKTSQVANRSSKMKSKK
jgi:hypothetical protein